MLPDKILQLANKYAEMAGADSPERKLSDFSHNLNMKLRIILGEMINDISTLMLKGFDKSLLKEMNKLKNQIREISFNFNSEKPYESAQRVVDLTTSRNTRAILENLDFISERHLEKNKEDFEEIRTPNFTFTHPQLKSIKLLISFGDYLSSYMAANPEMPGLKPVSPSDPPENNVETNPHAPQAMKQLA